MTEGSVVRVACIGAGPAAAMLLERLLANRARDWPELALDIHLIDPFPPGGGRIWRKDQSALLKLNSMLEDVGFFTDASCDIEGPIAPGPSFAEWVVGVRQGRYARPDSEDLALAAELDTIGARDFPSRRLGNAYLSWSFSETLERYAAGAQGRVSVRWHPDTAVDVVATGNQRHLVRLASGDEAQADIVLYTLGHNGSAPSAEAQRLAEFAARQGLQYFAPAFTAELPLDTIAAGSDVIVRGMGLAAVDLTVLLTEGRGGRFSRESDGQLTYVRSGREPRLHLGSRRGVPYRAKVTSRVVGDAVRLEYVGEAFRQAVERRLSPLDFERDVEPLVGAELVTGFYRELFTGHPERATTSWSDARPHLGRILEQHGAASGELEEFIAEVVPDPDDRLDLAAFARPLEFAPPATMPPPATDASPSNRVQQRVAQHIATDLRHRTDQRHSATAALFLSALHAYLAIADIPADRWNARSRTRSLPGRWFGAFSYLASGPPGHRLEELLALAAAGVVQFLGAGISVDPDASTRSFRASGSAVVQLPEAGTSVAEARVDAGVLIDAWLPEARAAASDNALLRRLVAAGRMRELGVASPDGIHTTGEIEAEETGRLPGSATEFAVGPFVAGFTGGAFTRPGLNSLPFRVHDRCARQMLEAAAAVVAARRIGAERIQMADVS